MSGDGLCDAGGDGDTLTPIVAERVAGMMLAKVLATVLVMV